MQLLPDIKESKSEDEVFSANKFETYSLGQYVLGQMESCLKTLRDKWNIVKNNHGKKLILAEDKEIHLSLTEQQTLLRTGDFLFNFLRSFLAEICKGWNIDSYSGKKFVMIGCPFLLSFFHYYRRLNLSFEQNSVVKDFNSKCTLSFER